MDAKIIFLPITKTWPRWFKIMLLFSFVLHLDLFYSALFFSVFLVFLNVIFPWHLLVS